MEKGEEEGNAPSSPDPFSQVAKGSKRKNALTP